VKSILLVEGETDRGFYNSVLRRLGIDHVEIRAPRAFEQPNTVTVFPTLVKVLIQQMNSGDVARLGVIADADHTSGGGIKERWQKFREAFDDGGYNMAEAPPKLRYLGSHLSHRDGLPDIGLWLMPDHQTNGMLEDFIIASGTVSEVQQELRTRAEGAWQQLPTKLFSEYHESKATLYTWIAWQKRPGLGLGTIVGEPLLDTGSEAYDGLTRWLKKTFT
jgi:hypothetical protein